MKKTYNPPLTTDPHAPLYRVDKAIEQAQERLSSAIDMKRHHTSHSLAQEVIKEAREALRKAEQRRAVEIRAIAEREAARRGDPT